MKKVSKIKKKTKGTRYIANVLKRYFPKRYPTFNSALPKAKEILQQIQSQGLRVNTKNIRNLGVAYKRPKKVPGGQRPFLYYKLLQPVSYFNLQDYPSFIKSTSNEVFFTSNLFNEGVEFVQGGTKPNYQSTFSSFVNYVNSEIDDNDPLSYEKDYLVVCKQPEFNSVTNRWESEIVSMNENKEESNYGYSPSLTPLSTIGTTEPSKKQKTKKSKQQVTQKTPDILKIESETEKTRQDNLNMAMKLFLNKDITKAEYKEMIELIKKK